MLPDWAKPVEDDGGSPFAAPEATSTLPAWAKPVGQSSPQRTLNGVPVLGDYTPLLEGRAKLRYGVSDEGYQSGVEKYGEEGFGAILHARESDPIESMPMAARIATKAPGNMLLKVDTLADKGNLVLSELMGDWSAARKYRKRIKYKEGLREYGDQMGVMATADNSIVSKIIEQGLTSATEFLAVSGLTGGAGVLPYLQATATADAYEEAKEQGKEGFAASMYAAAEGAGQTAITAVVGKTIAPGFERMGGKALGPVVTRHLGPSLSKLSGASEKVANAAIQGGAESFEEILQETASTVTATIAGVEREGTYLERAGFAAGAGFAGGAPVGFVAASKDFEDALAEVRRKTQEVVQATEDAQQHEGEPPPTDRDGFKKATGKPKTSSTYRDVYASVVESRQETATAQAEIDTQVSTQTSGQFESQSFDTEGTMPDVAEAVEQQPAEPQPDIIDTTPDVQEQINAELEDVARERFESKLDPQQLTPTEVEGLNAKVRTWTNDTDFVRKIVGLGGRDVRLPQQVLDRAEELYERDWELYDASVEHLTNLDIDWKYLIREYNNGKDIADIEGYDNALMTLTRFRYGDDFVQDNVDVAADELENILDGAEVRFGRAVFPNAVKGNLPTKEKSIKEAYEDVTESLPEPPDPEGQVEGEWFPERKVYLEDPTQVDYDPTLTSARNAWMRPLREYLNLPPFDTPARRAMILDLQEAKERGVPEVALELAASIVAKPRAINRVENHGLVIKAAELKQEYEQTLGKLMEADGQGDVGGAATYTAVAERIESELDVLTTALKKGGTEIARDLVARKLTVDSNYNLANVVARARVAKGAPLNESERRGFAAKNKEMQEADAKLGELDEKLDIATAEKAIGIGKKRARPTKAALDQAYDLVDKLLRAGCDIG